jgi:Family of unknown function (DUF6328)
VPEEPPHTERVETRHETPLERVDRNLEELVAELRVIITGTQVLFAFLLIVPFSSGFVHPGDFERAVYFTTLLLTAVAAACLIAPSAQHRLLFRLADKEHLVVVANRIVVAGLILLALAMCGCLLLVATELFGVGAGVLTVTLAAIPFCALWFAMPLLRRRSLAGRRKPPPPEADDAGADGKRRGAIRAQHARRS